MKSKLSLINGIILSTISLTDDAVDRQKLADLYIFYFFKNSSLSPHENNIFISIMLLTDNMNRLT